MYTHARQTPEVLELRREAGVWLKELREKRGISQREMAEMVGVLYYTYISQIETGRGKVPIDSYDSWAKALGLPTRIFVKQIMRYYDPVTYGHLFGDDIGDGATSLISLTEAR